MAIRADELESLLGLLGVAGPIRGPKGLPGTSRVGMDPASMEAMLRGLLADDDFMADYAARRPAADVERLERAARAAGLREAKARGDVRAKDAYRKGRRAGLERGRGSAGKGLLGTAGKYAKAGKFGTKLLYGAGILGTGLMALDLLMGAKEAAKDDTMSRARGMAAGEYDAFARAGLGGRSERDYGFSTRLAQQARRTSPQSLSMTSDLKALLNDAQIQQLSQMRQATKPGIREAYARFGLIP